MLGLNKGKLSIGEPIYRFDNNHSVDFDGVDDFIQLGQGFTYTQHTVSAWIKLGELSRTHTILSGRDSNTDLIRFWIASSDNKVRFRLGDGSNTTVTNPTALEAGRWYHIVATYDGTNLKIYVDSVLGHTLAASKNVNVTANLKIGEDDSSNRFMGKIDELAIWDRALTAAEVTEIYRIKYGANLVLNGRLDELGSELVTANDFSQFNTYGSVSINNNIVTIASTSNSGIFAGLLTNGKSYKVTINVLSLGDTGHAQVVNDSGTVMYAITTTGEQTFYFKHVVAVANIIIRATSNMSMSFTSLSIKQVDPNDRWTLNTGWSYGDSKAICDGSQTSTSNFVQSDTFDNDLTDTYKLSFDLVVTQGSVTASSGSMSQSFTTSGFKSFIGSPATGAGNLNFTAGTTFIGSVTNVMVEKQKYVASNLKLNSGNYKSADPVIVSTKSVDFDGAEEYLDAGNVGAVKSLSFWFNPDGDITSSSPMTRLFGFDESYYGISLGGSTGLLTGEVLTVLPNGNSRTGTTHTFEAGRWYHVAVVWNNTNEYYDIFINGVARTDLNTGTGLNSPFESFLIGTANDTSNFFNGQIDDVGIFSVSLNSDQVVEIYNQGVPSNLATSSAGLDGNLTGYWKMGDGTLDEAPLIADQTNATLGSDVDLTTGSTTAPASWQVISANSINWLNADNSLEFYDTGFTATAGKTYKITLTVSNYTGTNDLGWSSTGGVPNPEMRLTSNGTVSSAFVATGNVELRLFGRNTNTGTLTVSVNEVGGNPALMQNTPTIVTDAPLTKIRNYYRMGDGLLDKHQADNITFYSTRGLICDMIEPSLSTELITDGDFPAGTSAWALGTGWSLEAGACVRSGASDNTDFRQSISITANKIYQVSYTRVYVSGSTRTTNLFSDFETDGSNITLGDYRGTEETVTVVSFFMPTYTGTVPIRVFGINDWTGKITNVSVKEVNGVGGLMTNMLNTDITNDVPS